jgi:ABC-type sugar transport system permease subunit
VIANSHRAASDHQRSEVAQPAASLPTVARSTTRFFDALDRHAPSVFIGPAVVVILLFSIFPLIVSIWLSMTRFSLQADGWDLQFIGALNYKRLLFGSQQFHLLGTAAEAWPAWGWPVLLALLGLTAWYMAKASKIASLLPRVSTGIGFMAVTFISAAFLAPLSPWRESLVDPQIEAAELPWAIWLLMVVLIWVAAGLVVRFALRSAVSVVGWVGRQLAVTLGLWVVLVVLATANAQQGSLLTTLFYVIGGVTFQFAIGLGLAMLCAQPIKGRDFFRMAFFLPLMVTPVGIAYMFRMLADMQVGPLAPLASTLGWSIANWAEHAWSARFVVLIGDTWQWTPFIFIVMLAAVEGQPRDQLEAAQLDGAGPWRMFKDITWPAIAPSAAAVMLIRLIEAFKVIDLPNVLTNGGPGISTESLTLHAFIDWRTLNLGGSAAVAYMLLFISMVTAVGFYHRFVRIARGMQ